MLKCPVMTLHIEDTGGHWGPHAVTPLSMDVIGMMGRAALMIPCCVYSLLLYEIFL